MLISLQMCHHELLSSYNSYVSYLLNFCNCPSATFPERSAFWGNRLSPISIWSPMLPS